MKKPVLIVLVLATLGGAAWYGFTQLNREQTDELLLFGNIDVRQVELGFRVSGRLEMLGFEEGDSVEVGQILASLDKTPFEDDIHLAEAQVDVRIAEFEKFRTGTRPEEIEQARALVEERQSALRNAERNFERSLDLSRTGAASQRTLDNARAARDAATARLRSATEALELAEAGFRAEDVAAAQANLRVAEAELARAQTNIRDADLVAPEGGMILSRVQEPGAIVNNGSPVYTLSLINPVWVRTYVREPDLGRVYPGLAARVTTDTRPDQPYKGQVGFISPVAEFTPKTVETTSLRTDLVYRLRVIVENPDEGLRQGMPVTVELLTDGDGD